jgi:hypothetical protein
MHATNIMALFCEDIREEKNDIVTLVGVLPDTLNVVSTSNSDSVSILSKLCIYIRINFDPELDIGEPAVRLLLPEGEVLSLGNIGAEIVSKARTQAKEKGNPLAGVITRVVLAPFRPPRGGVVILEVVLNSVAHIVGALNFIVQTEAVTSSNVEQPRS